MPQKFIVRGQKVTKDKIALAKEFRRNMTGAETILWQRLRANQLGGWHFRRQQILYGYIADFYCHAASLIVEVDGDIHEYQRTEDSERDDALSRQGFKILHFQNYEIEKNLNTVLSKIMAICNQTSCIPQNSPPLEGEGSGERS